MLLEGDLARISHILQAAQDIALILEGRSYEEFLSNVTLRHAVVRCIEIVGEAAGRVSSELRAEAPEIPWQMMVRMRNRLIHGYFDV